VAISSDGTHDSILAVFHPGPRARITQIIFEENVNGYRSVNESTRRRQLEFKEGDWYNLSDIEQSRTLLMQLGVFEVVVIDTASVVFVDSAGRQMSDSNVSLRVFTKNSKDYDVGANLMLFQTAVDNYLNVGDRVDHASVHSTGHQPVVPGSAAGVRSSCLGWHGLA
jgi:hypothetical protein